MNEQFSIQLHIDELVLHGFAPSDRHRIGGALQDELRRLLADPAMATLYAPPSEIARLDAGSFRVAANSKPEAIGVHVAHSIHRNLRQ